MPMREYVEADAVSQRLSSHAAWQYPRNSSICGIKWRFIATMHRYSSIKRAALHIGLTLPLV
jgi:hypothetical protein